MCIDKLERVFKVAQLQNQFVCGDEFNVREDVFDYILIVLSLL